MRMTRVAATAAAAVLALTMAACGSDDGSGTGTGSGSGSGNNTATGIVGKAASGSLKIGVKADQPGLGLQTGTAYEGFDIEIAKIIAKGLGMQESGIQYVTTVSANREPYIQQGTVDLVVATYTINDERKTKVNFAGPYFMAGQDLLVPTASTITAPEQLAGKKVCSVTGSTPIQKVRDEQLTEPGNIVEFQGYSQCVDKLLTKEVDAVTTDDAILKGFASQDPDNLKVVGETFSEEPYGVGLPKDDKALRDKVNDILEAALSDGTWQDIYDGTLGKSGSKAEKPTIDRY